MNVPNLKTGHEYVAPTEDARNPTSLKHGAKDSLTDKNVVGKEDISSGGVPKGNLGGKNTTGGK